MPTASRRCSSRSLRQVDLRSGEDPDQASEETTARRQPAIFSSEALSARASARRYYE
jgi:hypothetical protein